MSTTTKETLSIQELKIVGHSLGINVYHALRTKVKKDKKLPKEFYRNYFCVGTEEHADYNILVMLEQKGITLRWNKYGNIYFYVTEEGIKVFREEFKLAITKTDTEK